MKIQNPKILQHTFLDDMYKDSYFPDPLVDQVKAVLLELCMQIETQQPQDLDGLYRLSHFATEQINDLQEAFDQANSEIETVARETISANVSFIAAAYGFVDADHEVLIETRDW
ncbi:hypothetical protein EC844_11620 [Acinetobacter calcoaceticus]|uniref:Uncharacterized protein n=1 Tax=Acinetobacter calcoaceticus TaxID=471 RepID=A0A4R1XLV6_ACICA|nr:hypothetical protein EC844_11620 [Acinetobacter calcoaceticus]